MSGLSASCVIAVPEDSGVLPKDRAPFVRVR